MWMDVDVALAEVPVNLMPLLDDTDFKTRETAVAYNAAGMDLVWNFVTTAGAFTQTAVTPTTAGNYDWAHQGDGMYSIEIPATGGASINNDTEGFGWFTGVATGVLPWRGPVIGFRAAGINNSLIDTGNTPLEVNTVKWLGTTVETPAVAGRPSVDTVKVAGNDPDTAITINRYAHTGTAQAGAAGTITLAAGASASNDFYNGCLVRIISGTGSGQRRWITDYVGATKVATVDSNWITNPDNTSVYEVL